MDGLVWLSYWKTRTEPSDGFLQTPVDNTLSSIADEKLLIYTPWFHCAPE